MKDRTAAMPMSMLDQLHEVEANPGDLRGLGSFGEAVAEIFVHEVLGHEVVVDEATRDKPQGVDHLILLRTSRGRLPFPASARNEDLQARLRRAPGQPDVVQ